MLKLLVLEVQLIGMAIHGRFTLNTTQQRIPGLPYMVGFPSSHFVEYVLCNVMCLEGGGAERGFN